MISTNIDDFIKDFLKNALKLDILDYQKVESGGEGYTILYVSNLNNDQAEVLESIGFEQIKGDLWCFYGFEIEIDRLKDPTILKYFEEVQKEKWYELVNLRSEIDDIFYRMQKEALFRTTHNTPRIVLKWHGKLTLDEHTFNDFIIDLNKIFTDPLPEKIDLSHNSDLNFLKGIKCIRNAKIAHDSSKIKQLEEATKYLSMLIGTDDLRHWYQFMNAQISIIEDGIDFLIEIKSKLMRFYERTSSGKT